MTQKMDFDKVQRQKIPFFDINIMKKLQEKKMFFYNFFSKPKWIISLTEFLAFAPRFG